MIYVSAKLSVTCYSNLVDILIFDEFIDDDGANMCSNVRIYCQSRKVYKCIENNSVCRVHYSEQLLT